MDDLPRTFPDQLRALFPGDAAAVSAEEAMARAGIENESRSRRARDVFFPGRRRPFGILKPAAWAICLVAVAVVLAVGLGTGHGHPASVPISRGHTTTTTSGVTTTTTSRQATTKTTPTTAGGGASPPLQPGNPVSVGDILSISFVDEEHGFAVAPISASGAYGQTMLATTSDGGSTWVARHVLPAFPTDPSVIFTSGTQGILWANGAQFIERTSDGGRTWNKVNLVGTALDASQRGSTIMLVDASACSPFGAATSSPCPTWIAWSSDGGSTWRQSEIAPSEHLGYGTGGEAGTLGDPSDAYVIAGSHLYITTDGGSTWVARTQPCGSLNFPGYFEVSATGGASPSVWAVCGGEPGAGNEEKVAYVSTDGGLSWSLRSASGFGAGTVSVGHLPVYGYVGPIVAVSASRAYMASGRLGILESGDGGRTWQSTSTTPQAGAGGNGTVDFVGPTRGWALFPPLGLWKTTDGSVWTALDGTR